MTWFFDRTGERWRTLRRPLLSLSAPAMLLALTACQVSDLSGRADLAPVPAALERRISSMDMELGSPIMLRIFKEEAKLEVWKATRGGRFERLKEYEICAWSGVLGPKLKEGDRQAPEGFYMVSPGLMNPNSNYHLSFNLGFPNAFDRSLGRTGSFLMVHGDCSSAGCYAVQNDQIQEIYALAREAFAGGQSAFQVQAFPFRMTPENMARYSDNENLPFWEMLKAGSDHFEATRRVPRVDVCGQRYVFNAVADRPFEPRAECPAYSVPSETERLVAQKRDADLAVRRTLIAKAERQDERRIRWNEREDAVAAFSGAGDDGRETGETAAIAAAETVSRQAQDEAPSPDRASPAAPASRPVAAVAASGAPRPVAAVPAEQPVSPAAPMGFADEQNGGFFSSVRRGSAGLLRRAGDLFD